MALDTILTLGATLLACGCCGLLTVRLTNPRLLGLGWLGGSFAAGGLGAILLLLYQRISPLFTIVLADVLILASFVLLHFAVLELLEIAFRAQFGILLLALQACTGLFVVYGGSRLRVRIVMVGLLIAAQALQTAYTLLRKLSGPLLIPGRFNAALLFLFAAFNLLRSFAQALGFLRNRTLALEVQGATFILFLAVALGIAFGFFWMTTATLTAKLEQMASTDPLTRIYNRRMFLAWCEKELARVRRNGGCFSVLMLDLDHFKQINDRFGHHTGDEILCAVVEKMQDATRGVDVLGRWGGEEFVVLLHSASSQAAFQVAQRLRLNVEKIQLPIPPQSETEGATRKVTVSVGIASYPGADDTVELMLRRADSALYHAKARGRNQVFFEAPCPGAMPLQTSGSSVHAAREHGGASALCRQPSPLQLRRALGSHDSSGGGILDT
jgi:diguanylate cyclase (GGDEF)-like protein